MIRYVFKDEGPIIIRNRRDADPQAIGEALEQIAAANGGRLTPQATVEAARRREHPLHKFFEWRPKEAAEAWRVQQARHLIACLRVVDETVSPERKTYAYISIVSAKGSGRSYVPSHQLITSSFLQAKALEMAIRDLGNIEKRYRDIADLCVDIREWRDRLSARRQQILDDPPPAREFGT
jgi:hypothetical protein